MEGNTPPPPRAAAPPSPARADILKALALGASGVLLGRPVLYALAVGGQAGVERALKLLRDELELAMVLAGCTSLAAVGPHMLLPAPGRGVAGGVGCCGGGGGACCGGGCAGSGGAGGGGGGGCGSGCCAGGGGGGECCCRHAGRHTARVASKL